MKLTADPELAARFDGRRCLVTGGLGFIGSNLVHALVAAGARVSVIDALVPQHGGDVRNLAGVADRVSVTVSPIWDREVVPGIVEGSEVIFNLAGQVSHHESMTAPMRDLDLNVRSHLQFLEYVRQRNPGAVVVHTSTRQVYGRPRYLPVDELHPTEPVDINGVDKLACEQYHLIYHRVHQVPTVALRLTNVYGPRQNLLKDGLGFLPVFIRRVLRGETISLFGDGSQQRDCLHVVDVVNAMLAAAVHPAALGEVFNLGHPEPMTLAEIAGTMLRSHPGGSVQMVPWPAELASIDIGSFAGDYSKATRVLGWSPTVQFADGVADTLAFYGSNPWYLSSI